MRGQDPFDYLFIYMGTTLIDIQDPKTHKSVLAEVGPRWDRFVNQIKQKSEDGTMGI